MEKENNKQTPLIIMLETQRDIERDIMKVLEGLYKSKQNKSSDKLIKKEK